MKVFRNSKTGELTEFRYMWMFNTYNSSRGTFRINLTLLPSVLLNPTRYYENYPDLVRIVDMFGYEHGDFGVVVEFNKSDTDSTIVDKLKFIINTLEKNGISFAGGIDMNLLPDLTYMQKYLEHTTSVNGISIQDILVVLSKNNPELVDRLMNSYPIASEQKFDPEQDTDLDLDSRLSNIVDRFKQALEKTKQVSAQIRRIAETTDKITEAFHNAPTEHDPTTYSSEDSSDYSNFQSHWI